METGVGDNPKVRRGRRTPGKVRVRGGSRTRRPGGVLLISHFKRKLATPLRSTDQQTKSPGMWSISFKYC